MNRPNIDRLTQLTINETNVLDDILNDPMLSNKEITTMFDYPPSYVDGHCDAIYRKLIPPEIYDNLTPTKRRVYILLKFTPRFAAMSDSWHKALIDPIFKVKE